MKTIGLFLATLCISVSLFAQNQETVERSTMENAIDQILQSNWEGARYWLEDAKQDEANGFLPDAWIGISWMTENKKKKAEEAYLQALREAGVDKQASLDDLDVFVRDMLFKLYMTAATTSLQNGQLAKANREYSVAIVAVPGRAEGWYQRGLTYAGSKQFEQAEYNFEQALMLDTSMAPAATNLGLLNYKLGRMKEAEAYYRKSEGIKPGVPDNLFGLGNIYFKHYKDMDKAIVHYRAAIEHKPDFKDAWSNIKMALKQQNDLANRIDVYASLYELAPDRYDLNFELGSYYAAGSDTTKARMMLTKALQMRPKTASIYVSLGSILLAQKKYGRALKTLNRAIALDEKNAYGWYNRGVAYYKMGNYDRADLDFAKAREINPNLQKEALR